MSFEWLFGSESKNPSPSIAELEGQLKSRQKELMELYENGGVKNRVQSPEELTLREQIKELDTTLLEARGKESQESR